MFAVGPQWRVCVGRAYDDKCARTAANSGASSVTTMKYIANDARFTPRAVVGNGSELYVWGAQETQIGEATNPTV